MKFLRILSLSKFLKIPSRRNNSSYHQSISDILQNSSDLDVITIKGWVKSLRKHKEYIFLDVNDGSTEKKLQLILPHSMLPENLNVGASVSATGKLSLSPKGQVELKTSDVQVYGDCDLSDGYPFLPKKQYLPEYIRQYLHLRPRTNKFSSLLRVRSAAMLAVHNYLNSKGYVSVNTPVITSNDCEGAGEMFRVLPDSNSLLKSMVKEDIPLEEAFFDTKAYLSVSGQLHLEAAAHSLSKVYTIGPIFRAENSKTRLHLAEFYMLEVEIAFIEKLEDLTQATEELLKNVTQTILDTSAQDITNCNGNHKDDRLWLDSKFPTLDYDEAVGIVKRNKDRFKEGFNEENGLSKEHELFLVKHTGGIPMFIVNFPKDAKPFYMKECEDDHTKVAAFDLLAPDVGEIVGGSLRERDYHKLKNNLPKGDSQLEWYLDLRKYGGVPTGGYGLGFERYLMLLLGIQNIKDVIPFPRWPHNCNL